MVALIVLLLILALFGGLGFAAHVLWFVLLIAVACGCSASSSARWTPGPDAGAGTGAGSSDRLRRRGRRQPASLTAPSGVSVQCGL